MYCLLTIILMIFAVCTIRIVLLEDNEELMEMKQKELE